MKTNVQIKEPRPSELATPYALVKRGGAVPGQRSRTKIAFLVWMDANAECPGYQAYFWRGYKWTKRRAFVAAHDVVTFYQQFPKSGEVAQARKQIPLTKPE